MNDCVLVFISILDLYNIPQVQMDTYVSLINDYKAYIYIHIYECNLHNLVRSDGEVEGGTVLIGIHIGDICFKYIIYNWIHLFKLL